MKRHLTEITIQRLRPPQKGKGYLEVFDLGYPGLAIRVGHGGAKTFEHFHRATGKLRRETLGRWPSVSLAEARDRWRKTREATAKGEAPVRNGKGPLFELVVQDWLRRDQSDNKQSSQYQLHRIVERDLLPAWRGKSVTAITKTDVIRLLDTIADRSPSMAKKVDAYTRRFFKWCRGRDVILVNPMDGMDALAATEARDRILTDDELRKVWRAASDGPHHGAVRLLILTGARKEEICALRWSEVNGDKIVLEGARTKNGKPHTIPLSKPAREILDSISRSGEFVFGGAKQIGSWARNKTALDKLCGVSDWRLHDLRRTVSTQMNELAMAEPHIVEAGPHGQGRRGCLQSGEVRSGQAGRTRGVGRSCRGACRGHAMTAKPPIPPEHVDNWVCEAVRKLFGDQPCSEVGGHLYRRVLVFLHADINPLDYDDQKGRELIERAMNGDTDADAALCGIASRLVRLGDPLPKYLRDYIATILKFRFAAPPKRRKGGDPYALDRRNFTALPGSAYGTKRTNSIAAVTSANDPLRTLRRKDRCEHSDPRVIRLAFGFALSSHSEARAKIFCTVQNKMVA